MQSVYKQKLRVKKTHFILPILSILFFCSCDDMASSENIKDIKSKKIYNGVRKNYLNGKLASTVTYKDSLKNGIAINYYPSGKVNMEFNYKDNKKDGPHKWYHENGKIYLEGNYTDGKKNGVFKLYRDNGTLKSEMPWSNDNPCVGLIEYTPSGKKIPTPKIIVKQKNTVKLDGKCAFSFSLSDKSKNVK